MAISKRQALEDLKSYNAAAPQFTDEELIERCNIVLRRYPEDNFHLVPKKLQLHGDWLRRALDSGGGSFLKSMDVSPDLARAAVRHTKSAIYSLPENLKDDEEVQMTVIEDLTYLDAFDRICQRAANAALIGIITSGMAGEAKKSYKQVLFKKASQSNVTFAEAVGRYPREIFTIPSTCWTPEMANVALRELDRAAPPLTAAEAGDFMKLVPPPRVADETVKRYPNSLLSVPDDNWTESLVNAAVHSDNIDYVTALKIRKRIQFHMKRPDRFPPELVETVSKIERRLYVPPSDKDPLVLMWNRKPPDHIDINVLTKDCLVIIYRSGDTFWQFGDALVKDALTKLFKTTKASLAGRCWHVNLDGLEAGRAETAKHRNQIEKDVADQTGITHRYAPMFDFVYNEDQFEFALRTLSGIYSGLTPNDRVLLHCSMGYGRSTACLELYYRIKVGTPDTADDECEAWLREHHSNCKEWISKAKKNPELRKRIKGVARETLTNVLFSGGMYGPGTLRDVSSE